MPNKMLIDASHPEETRVVVVRGNRIEEFDFESQDKKQLRGNIYLARVTRVEPSLQAAFVEYGGNRHGFLAFSEIHPDYYQIPVADRQALLRAEAAEARAEDEDDDEADGDENRERSRGRRRRRGRGRNDDAVGAAESGMRDVTEESQPEDPNPDVPAARQMEEAGEASAAGQDDGLAHAPGSGGSNDAPGGQEEGPPSGRSMAAAVEGDVISEPVSDLGRESDANGGGIEEVRNGAADEVESVGAEDALDEARARRKPLRRQYKIQEVIKRRQILLVQVVKEERGNKGAALTTYLSLAGRYSVLMPNTARGGGISRKITNLQDRKRLKEVVKDLDVPEGMGVILRTAGENRTKAEIKRDYEYLMRLWENVRSLTLKSTAPALVYEEGSLIKRSVRDLYNKDIDEILVAGEEGYREAKDFMRMLMPSHAKVVQPYRDTTPIFARNGIEAQLDRMLQPQVTLKSGGYIIINQTEALVSIDVNSGRSTKEHSIEDTALQTNLEAAEEVARQLRLRDLAGLIVIDFIDMEENRNNRAVEKKLKDCLKNDRARIQVGRISHFGLLEMSRQRIRASVLESTMKPCPHCGGTGHIRSDSSVALLVVRGIEEFLLKDSRSHITVRTPSATALYVLNHKRSTLVDMEKRFGVVITIEADETLGNQHYSIVRGAVAEKPDGFVEPASLPAAAYLEPEEADEEIVEIEEDEVEASVQDQRRERHDGGSAQEGDHRDRKRRRRRRRRGGRDRDERHGEQVHTGDEAHEAHAEAANDDEPLQDQASAAKAAEAGTAETGESDRKKRRRGKRGGKRNRREEEDGVSEVESDAVDGGTEGAEVGPTAADDAVAVEAEATSAETEPAMGAAPSGEVDQPPVALPEEEAVVEKPRRGTRQRKSAAAEGDGAVADSAAKPARKPRAPRKKVDAAEPAAAAATPEHVTSEALDRAAAQTEVEPMAPADPEETLESEAEAATVEEAVEVREPRQEPKPKKVGWWQRSKSFF